MKKRNKTLLSLTLGIFLAGMSGNVFAAEETHVIAQGDTFWTLSQKYQLPLDVILKLNNEKDPLQLQPGMVVKLSAPVTKPAAQPASKPAAQPETKPVHIESVAPKSVGPVVKTADGQELPVARCIPAKATAYTADASENGGYAGLDYFGNPLKVGSIAVDPNVIPLGSTVYVTGYKTNGLPASGMIARAVDVGGAIKGSKVDIFVPGGHADDFGIQDVKVYVLKK
ncbi:3D domain-containing protein [Brevibacillus ginsengisoli]|uniref:3D domain-containing protein n=1 Tax=Brevibacillus ginsengisoli TaxID=363854 RepID=UPI003CEB6ACC